MIFKSLIEVQIRVAYTILRHLASEYEREGVGCGREVGGRRSSCIDCEVMQQNSLAICQSSQCLVNKTKCPIFLELNGILLTVSHCCILFMCINMFALLITLLGIYDTIIISILQLK